MKKKNTTKLSARGAVASTAWLGGVVGILIGCVIGIALIKCVLEPLFGKKPSNNDARNSANHTNPSSDMRRAQLADQKSALPLMLGADVLGTLWDVARLESGELVIRQLSKNSGVHHIEAGLEPILRLQLVQLSNCFLLIFHGDVKEGT
jgi:hypothetical protein